MYADTNTGICRCAHQAQGQNRSEQDFHERSLFPRRTSLIYLRETQSVSGRPGGV
jgi:hypothetical protein